jgi:NTE family protein
MPFAPAIDRFERLARPLVLALSGGGANGAAQAGAAAALFEAGFRPDLIIGTSVGAWNGAWMAGHPDGEGGRALLRLWVDPSVRSLLRGVVRGYVGALARRRVAAFSDIHMRRIMLADAGFVDNFGSSRHWPAGRAPSSSSTPASAPSRAPPSG